MQGQKNEKTRDNESKANSMMCVLLHTHTNTLNLKTQVVCVTRNPSDQLMILATDGLWDVFTNEEVHELTWGRFQRELGKGRSSQVSERCGRCFVRVCVVGGCLCASVLQPMNGFTHEEAYFVPWLYTHTQQHAPHPQDAAKRTATWLTEKSLDRGSRDNITVVVVDVRVSKARKGTQVWVAAMIPLCSYPHDTCHDACMLSSR